MQSDFLYLVAAAPHEIPDWFEPDLPPRPEPLSARDALDDDQFHEYTGLGDWLERHDVSQEVLVVADAQAARNKEIEAWRNNAAKERYFQWPRYWARETLSRHAELKPLASGVFSVPREFLNVLQLALLMEPGDPLYETLIRGARQRLAELLGSA